MNGIKDLEIIKNPSEGNPFVIVYKHRGIPSAPLRENERSAVTLAAELFPEVKNVRGRKDIEYGLLHRIDNDTEGLLLIALTQDFYDYMLDEQKNGRFLKYYSARCLYVPDFYGQKEGFSTLGLMDAANENNIENILNHKTLCSRFRPYGIHNAEVRPVDGDSGRAALKKAGNREYLTEILEISRSREKDTLAYDVTCRISEGYRHQVRSHLAWCRLPIIGDRIYNPYCRDADEFEFFASGLEFLHPVSKRKIKIDVTPKCFGSNEKR